MISLLYVSRSALAPGHEAGQVAAIIETAVGRNLALGVTGSLTLVEGIFAQLLEGPEAHVNQLMISILRDSRHSDVRIVEINPASDRRFANWSMAFVPPSLAVRSHLRTLADRSSDVETGKAAAALIEAMSLGASSSIRLG